MTVDRWHPTAADDLRGQIPTVGMLIASARRVWRVEEVNEVPEVDWDDRDRQYTRRWPNCRPHYLVLSDPADTKAKPRHVKYWPNPFSRIGTYRDDHRPVCAACAEPWPCLHYDAAIEGRGAARQLEKYAAIPPGGCWSCGQVITSRSRTPILFPGENLLYPLGPPAVFHDRRGCRDDAVDYEDRWAKAAPDRQRRLTCEGYLRSAGRHSRCTLDPNCTGRHAQHLAGHCFSSYDPDCVHCLDWPYRGQTCPACGAIGNNISPVAPDQAAGGGR